MKCIFCGYNETKVTDSRPTDDNTSIRRRRECNSCGKRFTTYEKIELQPLYIVKKDGSRQPFDTSKIKVGVLKACEKRPVSMSDIDEMVQGIEMTLYNSMEREIPSHTIGELVMQKLKDMDEVAFVRFASVYRQFKDINSFMLELHSLLQERVE